MFENFQFRNLEYDLKFFFADEYENAPSSKIKKIIAYNLQTFDAAEEALRYLDYVVAYEAIIFSLYDRANKYSIFYLLGDIKNYLKKIRFQDSKAKMKEDLERHLEEVEDDFVRYIRDNGNETEILRHYLKLYNPKPDLAEEAKKLDQEFYTIQETAEILKVTPQSIYNWISDGKLKATRISEKRQRISREEIERFVNG